MTTARPILLIVLLASIAVIGGALVFQYVIGLQPCELCFAERWPYYGAIAIAVIALATGARGAVWWVGLLALIFLGSAGLAGYHVGVEQHWIAGPTACTGGASGAKTPEELMKFLSEQQPVRCDEVQWTLAGVSLAGWNIVTSLGLLAVTAFGLGRIRRERAR
ncbi:MAG TPA: disulfide bond formation protein B [Stellaceae bacterium]|nr:disulfide bond formation protein B [Stellaceae bacterium]